MWEGTTAPAHLVRSGTQTGEEKVNKSEIFETLFDAIFSLSRNICEDVDECSNASMCVGGKCTNYVRTYACECKKGYQFDKASKTCVGKLASYQLIKIKVFCLQIKQRASKNSNDVLSFFLLVLIVYWSQFLRLCIQGWNRIGKQHNALLLSRDRILI